VGRGGQTLPACLRGAKAQPVRLLVLSDTYPPHNLGGAGEVAHFVSRAVAGRGHDVLVLTGTDRKADAGETTHDGVRVRRFHLPVPNILRLHLSVLNPLAAAQVRRSAAEFRPDVVHAHNVHERLSFASLPAARLGGAPLVFTAHDYLLFCLTKFLCSGGASDYHATPVRCIHCRHIRRVPGRNAAVHQLVKHNAAVIACISHAQRATLACNGFDDVPLEVVHNGLDPHVPVFDAAQRAGFRQRHGIDERPLVFFGGRISGAKGGDQLLRAVAIARRSLDCQVAIAGDRDAYFKIARRLAGEVGLDQGALHTLGWLEREQLDLAFEAADVSATPSVYPDPFNLMNLRAMAHRRAVAGTQYGGTPEIVVDGVTGLIADPWQPEQFGGALVSLLSDPARAAAMGEAGRRRLETEFTLDKQVESYLALYARGK
jgi:glycosyltransferase involved in cell wall biosynthesis